MDKSPEPSFKAGSDGFAGDEIVIAAPADLEALVSTRGWRRKVSSDGIVLRSEFLDETETRHWQESIDRRREACGCHVGTIMMLGSILGFAVHFSFRSAGWDLSPGDIGLMLSVTCLALFSGKLAGSIWARRGLDKIIRQLKLEFTRREAALRGEVNHP